MKKSIITTFLAGTPSSTYSVATGYSVGSEWVNTNNGNRFYHKTDGNWVPLNVDSPFYIQGGTSSAFDTTSNIYRTGTINIGTDDNTLYSGGKSTLFVKGTTSSIVKVVGIGATWSDSVSIFLVEDSGKVSIGPTFSSAFSGSPYNSKLDVNGIINTNSIIYSGGGYIFYDGGTGMLPGPSGNIRFISYGVGDAFKFEPQYTTSNFSGVGLGNNIQRIILQEYTIAASFSNNQIRMIELSPTINKTGTASGIDRGLYIKPTLTSDINKFRSIEVTNGDVLFSTTGGNVGIGLTGPSTKLHIYATQSGVFRLEDGTQGSGKLLVSDATGVASWTASMVEPSQITITATSSITTDTTASNGYGQKGKNVVIDNGSNAINITVNGGTDFVASYVKHGTASITFVQGSGRTLIQVDTTAVLNGAVGSTATISSILTTDYLRISNA